MNKRNVRPSKAYAKKYLAVPRLEDMKISKDKQLTHWKNPSAYLETEYGYISYRKWFRKEAARINADPERKKRVYVDTDKNGLQCLKEEPKKTDHESLNWL